MIHNHKSRRGTDSNPPRHNNNENVGTGSSSCEPSDSYSCSDDDDNDSSSSEYDSSSGSDSHSHGSSGSSSNSCRDDTESAITRSTTMQPIPTPPPGIDHHETHPWFTTTTTTNPTTVTSSSSSYHSLSPNNNSTQYHNPLDTNSNNNNNNNDDNDSNDEDFDPIIEPCRNNKKNNSKNIITSSLFSSIAVATIMLRQRRHPGGDNDNETYSTTTTTAATTTTSTKSKHHYRNQKSTKLYSHLNQPHETNRKTVSSQQSRNSNRQRNHCCWIWTSIGNDINNQRLFGPLVSFCGYGNQKNHNNIYHRTKSQRRRKRKSYVPTMINTMATYLLGMCIMTWLVVLVRNCMNGMPSTTTQTNTDSMPPMPGYHRDDLPLRERTRLRRNRPPSNHSTRHDKSSQNWLVRLGLFMNSFLLGAWTSESNIPVSMPMNHNMIGKAGDSEDLPKECQRAEWQSYNYPTCNDIYEIDLPNMIRISPRKHYHDTGRLYIDKNSKLHDNDTIADITPISNMFNMGYVAQGFWRSVWAVHPPRRDVTNAKNHHHYNNTATDPNVVVLKTMRRSHELSTRNYDRHRRDAIVMEQLTSSPYVMDIYGFCGNSVLTEYMDLTLEDIALDESQDPIIATDSGEEIVVTSTRRVQLALEMVRGVQAIHEVHGGPIVHADLQAKQFLISRRSGTVKINDFNRCRFMASKHINKTIFDSDIDAMESVANVSRTTTTTVPCKFRIPSSPGISRSPEEYMEDELDEKIDVYSVGHVLFNLLSYREAWDGYHTITAQQRMMNGEIPNMDLFVGNINNNNNSQSTPILHALSDLPFHIQEWYINVTKLAYTFDPSERVSASTLALELEAMLTEIQETGYK